MRLHVLSDVHLETRGEGWRALVDSIPSGVGDVLVLAGDILSLAEADVAKEMLARLRTKAREVVYVLGNHEHYGGVFGITHEIAAKVCRESEVRLLDREVVEIDGRRFVGTTLWFPFSKAAHQHRLLMTDFRAITGFEERVYVDNERDVAFLRGVVRPGDIVTTHHLPSQGSVAPEYRVGVSAPLNPFFVCDCEDVIGAGRPAVWIHGHTHSPCEYRLGETRVVCNPIGYGDEPMAGRLDFCIEV